MSETSKKVSDVVKPVLVDTIVTQAYAALIALPGFGWIFAAPVVSPVVRFIIRGVAVWLVDKTAMNLSLLFIQIDLAYEVSTAEEAREKLKAMLENPVAYSAEEQKRIDEYFDETTIALIQLAIKRL